MAIPNQVIEEWIDETLKQDEDERKEDAKEGNSDKLPIAYQALGKSSKATVRYEIDYTSLTKTGIQPRLAERLQRMLYVYSVGFYGLIKEIAA